MSRPDVCSGQDDASAEQLGASAEQLGASAEKPGASAIQEWGLLGEVLRRVIHVTGVSVTYPPDHGDPYVFPDGVARKGIKHEAVPFASDGVTEANTEEATRSTRCAQWPRAGLSHVRCTRQRSGGRLERHSSSGGRGRPQFRRRCSRD